MLARVTYFTSRGPVSRASLSGTRGFAHCQRADVRIREWRNSGKKPGLFHNAGVNMKTRLLICALVALSCGKNDVQDQARATAQAEAQIQEMISSLYSGFTRAYNDGGVNTDSLIDAYYDKDVHYVTSWGWTEPDRFDKGAAAICRGTCEELHTAHRVSSSEIIWRWGVRLLHPPANHYGRRYASRGVSAHHLCSRATGNRLEDCSCPSLNGLRDISAIHRYAETEERQQVTAL